MKILIKGLLIEHPKEYPSHFLKRKWVAEKPSGKEKPRIFVNLLRIIILYIRNSLALMKAVSPFSKNK